MANEVRLTTPKGIAQFAWLNKADTKFNDMGEYKVNLIVPETEAKAFCKQVSEARDAFIAGDKKKKKAPLPFEKEVDDQGNETGNIIIKTKVKNSRTRDGGVWERKPKLFDAIGQKIDANIGGGSTIKVNVQVYIWDVATAGGVGVMLQPVAVQVIDLVEFGGGDLAASFGFGVEDGFVSEVLKESDNPSKEPSPDDMDTADTTDEDSDLY